MDRCPIECLPDGSGLLLRVRLSPNAKRDAILGVAADQDGVAWMTASVTAVPEDGRANKALIKLLAKTWKTPKSGIAIVRGQTSRTKTLRLTGDPEELSDLIGTTIRSGTGV